MSNKSQRRNNKPMTEMSHKYYLKDLTGQEFHEVSEKEFDDIIVNNNFRAAYQMRYEPDNIYRRNFYCEGKIIGFIETTIKA